MIYNVATEPRLDVEIPGSEYAKKLPRFASTVRPHLEQSEDGATLATVPHVPGVRADVLYTSSDLVAIGVLSWGRVGPKRTITFLCPVGAAWRRLGWKSLTAEQQRAFHDSVPFAWSQLYNHPDTPHWGPEVIPAKEAQISYKIMRYDPATGALGSIYKPSWEYTVGAVAHQRAVRHHGGGIYSYPDLEKLIALFQAGSIFPALRQSTDTLAVVECAVWGTVVRYEQGHPGKMATTYLRPLRIVRVLRAAGGDTWLMIHFDR